MSPQPEKPKHEPAEVNLAAITQDGRTGFLVFDINSAGRVHVSFDYDEDHEVTDEAIQKARETGVGERARQRIEAEPQLYKRLAKGDDDEDDEPELEAIP